MRKMKSGYALIAVLAISISVFLVASTAIMACHHLRNANRDVAERVQARADRLSER